MNTELPQPLEEWKEVNPAGDEIITEPIPPIAEPGPEVRAFRVVTTRFSPRRVVRSKPESSLRVCRTKWLAVTAMEDQTPMVRLESGAGSWLAGGCLVGRIGSREFGKTLDHTGKKEKRNTFRRRKKVGQWGT